MSQQVGSKATLARCVVSPLFAQSDAPNNMNVTRRMVSPDGINGVLLRHLFTPIHLSSSVAVFHRQEDHRGSHLIVTEVDACKLQSERQGLLFGFCKIGRSPAAGGAHNPLERAWANLVRGPSFRVLQKGAVTFDAAGLVSTGCIPCRSLVGVVLTKRCGIASGRCSNSYRE